MSCGHSVTLLFGIFYILSLRDPDYDSADYHFKIDFENMDQRTGGKWLIHGIKHHKDNQLQSLELTRRIS